MADHPWIVRPWPNPAAAWRLVCLPYAGGSMATFRGWATGLPVAELLVAQLPGRDARMREPAGRDLQATADAVAQAVTPYDDRPCVIYGHSMGALIAFEVVRRLRSTRVPVAALAVSGRRGPSLPERLAPVAHLPIEEFVEEMQGRYGAIPAIVLQDPELRELFLPMLQADIASVEGYRYEAAEPLACPILAYGGVTDPHATRAELDRWADETTLRHTIRVFPGGHFFIQTARDQVLAALSQDVAGACQSAAMAGMEP